LTASAAVLIVFSMPRTARAVEAGVIYHVLNRGNGRSFLFHKDGDFEAFEKILGQALERYPVDLLAYCLMGNHWHLIVRPRTRKSLGQFMGWLGVTHVRRHHEHYHTRGGGHVYQGRFKSFPVQSDEHLLIVCRYVEANALRAGLVLRAKEWRWCSMWKRGNGSGWLKLTDWPVERPDNWSALVEARLPEKRLAELRVSVNRGRPFGDERWVKQTSKRLGLEFTLRGPGRPKKVKRSKKNQ
jgi:REP-associated tyrosine transposase